MKRKLLTMIIIIMLIMGVTSAFAFAESETTDIRTVSQLKDALRHDLSTEEKTALLENVKEAVVAEFMEEKLNKAVELINSKGLNVNLLTLPNGSSYGTQMFDLGDGCIMTVELSDSVQGYLNGIAELGPENALERSDPWKAYGDRAFTVQTSVKVAGIAAMMRLVNNYTLSANGIDERPGKASCSWKLSTGQITKGLPTVTDGVARTPGASDVNMHCDYTLIQRNVVTSAHKYRLNTTIGYVAINKAEKKIKVRQSWSLSKVS